jgi:hypothetical protein
MRRMPAVLLAVALAGCAAPAPTATGTVAATVGPLACGELAADTCESAAEAAETLTGTRALAVEALPIPSDGGLEMVERYLVRLTAESGAGEQLAEVVRFTGSENWSVRRLDAEPAPEP